MTTTDSATTLTEGRWVVTTAASSYIIDVDEEWLIRRPGTGSALEDTDDIRWFVSNLTGDNEKLPLNPDQPIVVDIGSRAVFYLDHYTSYRNTTPVQSFERIERDYPVEAAV